ncbi:unnamed protein product [Fraxinus pennsylvanica]|uniref:Uncharacterized protein n=1 Tax=Fraxinus pennsylvanica TaxID=56036 RepID=A0AAD1ZEZ0_9LAMI|nr:unnamed protein product [Fraxinus pennsylvanica]
MAPLLLMIDRLTIPPYFVNIAKPVYLLMLILVNLSLLLDCGNYVSIVPSLSLQLVQQVSSEEMGIFEEIKSILGENDGDDSKFIAPFTLLSKNIVESFRYGVGVDLSCQNSEAYEAGIFYLLKHDKVLSKKDPVPQLHDVPDYLLDPTTLEASKIVKLARAAIGNANPIGRK